MEATSACAEAEAERWLEDHGQTLFAFALQRVRSADIAEDLVQETLLAAWRGRERFDGRSTRQTWLIGILRHKIADYLRQAGRAQARPSVRQFFDDGGVWREAVDRWRVRPEDAAQMSELRGILALCLAAMLGPLRDCFARRVAQAQPPDAICKELNLSAGNLRVRLHRARCCCVRAESLPTPALPRPAAWSGCIRVSSARSAGRRACR
jgi:RNA polymerase sigma-70 factor (ECF subfamily)